GLVARDLHLDRKAGAGRVVDPHPEIELAERVPHEVLPTLDDEAEAAEWRRHPGGPLGGAVERGLDPVSVPWLPHREVQVLGKAITREEALTEGGPALEGHHLAQVCVGVQR